MTEAQVFDVIKALVAATYKVMINNAVKNGFIASAKIVGKGIAKNLTKALDIIGKISAVEQSLERGVGITLPDALAIERSVIVLGTPFEPRIVNFDPVFGHAGDLVTVHGFNFPNSIEDIEVSFCQFTSSVDPDEENPDALPDNKKIKVVPEAISETSLVIRVPTNWVDVLTGDNAFLCVETTDGKRTTTRRLPAGKQEFTYLKPPGLLEVIPSPTPARGLITIHGTNFNIISPQSHEVFFDDNEFGVLPSSVTPTNLTVAIPTSLSVGPHTVSVQIGEMRTDPLTFSVHDPVGEASGFTVSGIGMTVNLLDYSNAPDANISFKEALLLMSGGLGRGVEQHLECEVAVPILPEDCLLVPRETDLVSNDNMAGLGGGATSRDGMTISEDFRGQVFMLTEPLPVFSNGDSVNFNGLILDGSNLPAGTPGIDFNGNQNVHIEDVVLRNFPGHGIHFRNSASGHNLIDVRVEDCGGTGVYFQDNASQITLMGTEVSGTGEHGLYLSGANVTRNIIDIPSVSVTDILGLFEDADAFGIVIDRGAHHNFVEPGTVRENALGGALITGPDTDANTLGDPSFVVPRYSTFYRNGGHGIHLEDGVEFTTVRHVNPAGNTGAGILLEGPSNAYNTIDGVHTGIDYFTTPGTPVAESNGGAGVHLKDGAHHNIIGGRIPGGFGERSSFLNNGGPGVLIEGVGTSFNTVTRAHFGFDDPVVGIWNLGQPFFLPNGTAGIHVRNGASSNVFGAFHSFLDLHLHGQPNGAGILIEGIGTDFNEVFGNQIGVSHGFIIPVPELRLGVGIHIKDGPKGTVIGKTGQFVSFVGPPPNTPFFPYRPYNEIGGCDIGILLDNCGPAASQSGQPIFPNIVQNNFVGTDLFGTSLPNDIGIAIKNGANRNRIGGTRVTEGNTIGHNVDAGILIEDNVITSGLNDFSHNTIFSSGASVIGGGITNPLLSPPLGIGIHVKGTSSGNVIGTDRKYSNEIHDNVVGVYLENVSGNTIQGSEIDANIVAGVMVVGGSQNVIGANIATVRNVITKNGSNSPEQGGIIIAGSSNNEVTGNLIGLENGADTANGNKGTGILVKDGNNNVIGGGGKPLGNAIGNSTSHGVEITGSSSGNRLHNNAIGGRALFSYPNAGSGVHFNGGASGNLVGGKSTSILGFGMVKAENDIARNLGDGVTIDGASTTGNSILYNSIHRNAGKGINHVNSGNQDTPPPVAAVFDGTTISGDVPSLLEIPVGSTIQIFGDQIIGGIPQGETFIGEGKVLTGGVLSFATAGLPLFAKMTMTATRGDTGSTSTFGTDIDFDRGLSLAREGSATTRTAPASQEIAVFPFEIGSLNGDSIASSITFMASGTIDDTSISAVRIYRDADKDGTITAADLMLGESNGFTEDNGSTTVNFTDGQIPSNDTQNWLATVVLPTPPADGASIQLSIVAKESVSATYVFPIGEPAEPSNNFPLASDMLTVSSADSLQTWKEMNFTGPELMDDATSGNNGNPDGDLLDNFAEYALGLNPKIANNQVYLAPTVEGNKLVWSYTRSKTADLAQFRLSASTALPTLIGISSLFQEVSVTDNLDGTETVRIESVDPVGTVPHLFLILEIVGPAPSQPDV